MNYKVKYSDDALKALKKIDSYQAKIIISWIEKNLIGCDNPRIFGKPLAESLKGFWRYRVGSYRIIAEILDDFILIKIVYIGHRREIYR